MESKQVRYLSNKYLKTVQTLFIINAAVWLVFGIISLVRIGLNNQSVTQFVIAILMFGNVGAMLLSAWLIGKQAILYKVFAFSVLIVNIILTFTDQFGLFDFITLVIDLVIVGLLVVMAFKNHFVRTVNEN